MKVYRGFAALMFLACALTASQLPADIIVLKSQGQIQGEIVPAREPGETTMVVKLESGGSVTVEKSQIKTLISQNPAEKEYAKIAPGYADTVAAQWELAEWCREHSLNALRTAHLERVVELDTDHKEARAALGYSHTDGKWIRQDQLMKERGFVLFKGKWMMPQEVELLEKKSKDNVADGEWKKKLKMWRGWLVSRDRARQGHDNIAAIKDPAAVGALSAALESDGSRENHLLFIETLAQIGTGDALKAIIDCSLEDGDKETRISALEALAPQRSPELASYYIAALHSKDNVRINRAGLGLKYMNDPSSVMPLIEALVTTHIVELAPAGNPGQTSATFGGPTGGGSGGGGGMGGLSVGAKSTKARVTAHNEEVLSALVTITGVNYSFDVANWKAWYASQKRSAAVNARRD